MNRERKSPGPAFVDAVRALLDLAPLNATVRARRGRRVKLNG